LARAASASAALSPASRRLDGHARDGRAGGHGLDAAEVAAVAARARLVDADVAHVAGRAAAPRYTSPWQTMPQPMPVPTLITRKLLRLR
jgi:hypothetical protein